MTACARPRWMSRCSRQAPIRSPADSLEHARMAISWIVMVGSYRFVDWRQCAPATLRRDSKT
jgi:hypothetical protein